MSWFEDWFDSPLYEKLYAYRNEEEAAKLADLIEKEIPKDNYPHLLDLGCGRGRHSLTLASRGYHVTGVDLSEEAIKTAKQKAKARGIENVRFLTGDMRDPLDENFDAVVNLFTTFGYFLEDEENISVLTSVKQMLKPGGLFLIDYLNAELVKKTLVPEEDGHYDGFRFHIRRYIENEMVFKDIRFSGGTLPEPVEYRERVKLYGSEWFREQFENLGFTLMKTWGGYTGSDFDEGSSARLIMVVRK
jgi:cyclopropane fatty-acyl-phospholipid synthase-like methyltransferase